MNMILSAYGFGTNLDNNWNYNYIQYIRNSVHESKYHGGHLI